jgi:hypothetical protein
MSEAHNGPERRKTEAYRELPVDEVSWASFYARFKVVEQMQTDVAPTPPIVRQVEQNTSRIRSLDLKFYAILGAVVAGFIGRTLIDVGL